MAASHRREGEAQHRHPRESRPSKYAAVGVRQDRNEPRDSSRRSEVLKWTSCSTFRGCFVKMSRIVISVRARNCRMYTKVVLHKQTSLRFLQNPAVVGRQTTARFCLPGPYRTPLERQNLEPQQNGTLPDVLSLMRCNFNVPPFYSALVIVACLFEPSVVLHRTRTYQPLAANCSQSMFCSFY